jgi:hypothetical protein
VTDELLWRWIKAKGGVVEAEQALVTHAQWRIELGRISKVIQTLQSHSNRIKGARKEGNLKDTLNAGAMLKAATN